MSSQFDSPDALIASIAQAGSAMSAGWMGLVPGAAGGGASFSDPAAWATAFATDPERLAELQSEYAARQAKLWSAMLAREPGSSPVTPVVLPESGDKRFRGAEWRDRTNLRLSTTII